jgi:DNA repair protein RadC
LFERFVVLSLDSRNTLLAMDIVADGGVDSCSVDPRLVFDAALRAGAVAIVVVHNHPSGSAEPSLPDISTSRRLAQVGKALSVRVLDSIVVVRDSYVSLAERRLLDQSTLAALG